MIENAAGNISHGWSLLLIRESQCLVNVLCRKEFQVEDFLGGFMLAVNHFNGVTQGASSYNALISFQLNVTFTSFSLFKI